MKTKRLFLPVTAMVIGIAGAASINAKPAQSAALAAFWERQSASSCNEIECSTTNTGANCQLSYPIHSNSNCNSVANVEGLKRP